MEAYVHITITVFMNPLSLIDQLALFSGFLQVFGYALYIHKQILKEADPNPVAWLMFAYGTSILTILEFDAGASWQLLLLPALCAALSCIVASACWWRGRMRWPEPFADKIAFVLDLILTAAYAASWLSYQHGSIDDSQRRFLLITFLICSNATTLTAFAPIIRQSYLEPWTERSRAWIVWTSAYLMLFATAILSSWQELSMAIERASDTQQWWSSLVLNPSVAFLYYPAVNIIIHGTIALLVRPSRRKRKLTAAVPR